MAMPFAAALAGRALNRQAGSSPTRLWLGLLFLGFAVIALGAIRSRAGIALVVPALGLSLLTAWAAMKGRRPAAAILSLVGTAGVCIAMAGFFVVGLMLALGLTQRAARRPVRELANGR